MISRSKNHDWQRTFMKYNMEMESKTNTFGYIGVNVSKILVILCYCLRFVSSCIILKQTLKIAIFLKYQIKEYFTIGLRQGYSFTMNLICAK